VKKGEAIGEEMVDLNEGALLVRLWREQVGM
jgi:hypothetical protein